MRLFVGLLLGGLVIVAGLFMLIAVLTYVLIPLVAVVLALFGFGG